MNACTEYQEYDYKDRLQNLHERVDDYNLMRSILLRIYNARIAMNQDAVIDALNDIDNLFREENTNQHQ